MHDDFAVKNNAKGLTFLRKPFCPCFDWPCLFVF